MIALLASFFASFVVTLLIIKFEHLHQHLSGDFELLGPQKMHSSSVPRIGGISIAAGLLAAIIIKLLNNASLLYELTFFLCAIPTFGIGLAEDLTKRIGVKPRLLLTALSAYFASQSLGAIVTTLNVPGIDSGLQIPGVAVLFTIFAITGLANAYNIIDGFNGLASMVGIITLMALAYICIKVNDPTLMFLSFIMLAAIIGFFIWNYPAGRIFLGDGGAYLIGFWIALISILLVNKHPEISPWFALLINAYPIVETLFTIYRRKIHQNKNPGHPDGMHFHTLLYRRVFNTHFQNSKSSMLSANARTSPYLWLLSSIAIIPAIIWWHSTPILIGFSLAFCLVYWWLYRQVVYFKTPGWLHN